MAAAGIPKLAIGNKMMIEETKRSILDALCVAKNLIINSLIVYGGGSTNISCSIVVEAAADRHTRVEEYAISSFADALDGIHCLWRKTVVCHLLILTVRRGCGNCRYGFSRCQATPATARH